MAETIPKSRLEEILAGCEGVTPGPWGYRPEKYDDWGFVRAPSPDSLPGELVAVIKKHDYVGDDELSRHRVARTDPAATDGQHVARLDPATVVAIVTELLAARANVEELTKERDKALSNMEAATEVQNDATAALLNEAAAREAAESSLASVTAERDSSDRHLGNVLTLLAELHSDDRCRAFVSALDHFNSAHPDAQVEPVDGWVTRLVHEGPLDRARALSEVSK